MNRKMSEKSWAVIAKRELASYFSSPVAYIVSGLFLLFSGFIFFSAFFIAKRAELRVFFEILPILYSFFIPAMAMKSFSEEKKSGSFETLMTLPVRTSEIVMGKYLAVFVSAASLLVPTLFYVITCLAFSPTGIDAGPCIGGYIGALLLAAAFSAIGVFASSVTRNQIVAFFFAFAASITLSLINVFSVLLPTVIVDAVTFICVSSHFQSVARGIIDSRDIVYFMSITVFFIALTSWKIEKAKRAE